MYLLADRREKNWRMKNDTEMLSHFNLNWLYWPVNMMVTTPDNTTATKYNSPTEFVGEETIMNSSYADVNSSLSTSKKESNISQFLLLLAAPLLRWGFSNDTL